MKIKFKKQAYQTRAVEAVAGCFKGQPNTENAEQYSALLQIIGVKDDLLEKVFGTAQETQ